MQLELLEIPVKNQRELIDLLAGDRLDIIFHNSFDSLETDSDLALLAILAESFIMILSEIHPLAQQPQIQLQDLAAEPLILPDLDILPFYKQIVTRSQELGFEPKIVPNVKVTGIVTILSLVAAGMGIAILPNHIQIPYHQGVIYRPIADPKLTRQAVAMWRETNDSIVLHQFLDLVRKSIDSY